MYDRQSGVSIYIRNEVCLKGLPGVVEWKLFDQVFCTQDYCENCRYMDKTKSRALLESKANPNCLC